MSILTEIQKLQYNTDWLFGVAACVPESEVWQKWTRLDDNTILVSTVVTTNDKEWGNEVGLAKEVFRRPWERIK